MRSSLLLAFATTVAAASFIASAASAASRTYAVAGPLAVEVTKLDAATDIVVPKTGGPYPLIVVSHGFSATGANQLGWAKHFASWGFVVAVPSFASPFSPNHAANGTTVATLVTTLTGGAGAAQKVKPGAFGLEGHSAGGLATILATASVEPAAVVLFDPVDANGAAKPALGKLCSPTMAILAAASACNSQGEWSTAGVASPGERISFTVAGSTHCDGENAPRGLCAVGCGGGADATRQESYAHYATAMFLAKLAGDTAAASALTQATLTGDTALAGATTAAATCSPKSGPGPAGPPDASAPGVTPPPASSGASSGGPSPPAATAEPAPESSGDGGGGCAITRSPRSRDIAGLAALAALAVTLVRRSSRARRR